MLWLIYSLRDDHDSLRTIEHMHPVITFKTPQYDRHLTSLFFSLHLLYRSHVGTKEAIITLNFQSLLCHLWTLTHCVFHMKCSLPVPLSPLPQAIPSLKKCLNSYLLQEALPDSPKSNCPSSLGIQLFFITLSGIYFIHPYIYIISCLEDITPVNIYATY